MNYRSLFPALTLLTTLLFPSPALYAATIDFEGLADSSSVGGTYSTLGITLSGATVLTAGVSLNEFEFPPHSGANVVFDDGGPLSGIFSTPMNTISAYLTYTVPITLYAYDGAGLLVGSISSGSPANTVSSGGTPNELLTLSSAAGISSFSFVGDTLGGSFTLDDLAFEQTATVPDAGSCAAMLGISMAALFAIRRVVAHRS